MYSGRVTRSAAKLLNVQQASAACEEGKKRKPENEGVKVREKRRKSEEEENEETLVRRKTKGTEEETKAEKEKPKGRTRARKVCKSLPFFFLVLAILT